MTTTQLYEKALTKWGIGNQCIKLSEECGELVQAICKFSLKKGRKSSVASEIADVQILCEQITYALNLKEDVLKYRNLKLKKVEKRLK